MFRIILSFLLLVLLQTGFAFSATITVDTTVDTPPDGNCTLRQAVASINAGDTAGTDCTATGAFGTNDTIDFNLPNPSTINMDGGSGSFPIDVNMSIMGPGSDMLTISGINVLPIFIVDGAVTDANISGLTIVDGQSAVSGGCIINDGGVLTLSDITLMGCDTMQNGGAILNNDPGNLTINDSLITGNTAEGNGGGINSVGTLTVNNSTVSGNDADGVASVGGGINCQGTTNINESTISGNTATLAAGGILNNLSSNLTITNSTISGNNQTDAAGSGGGGVAQSLMGSTFINNSTITGNSADAGGGGILSSGTVSVDGSIVANQTLGGDCAGSGTITSTGGNVESGTSCGFMSAGDLQDTDPLLGALANNGGPTDTHILLPGSPAIDNAGTCGLTDDQRGEPREANDCDSGSVEVQKASLTITKDTDPAGLNGFNFSSDIPDTACTPNLISGNFILNDDGSISCTITEGSYSIAETIPADNTLTISCATEPADGVTINNTMGTLDFTTVAADTAVDCTFTNVDDSVFSLNVVLAGPGTGTVTGPTGVPNNGGIDCPGDCTESYNPGTNVTLVATANAGSEFQGWSDDCNANGEVTINGNRTCVATFKVEGGGDVLNPGDPLEFIQDDIPEVEEGGEGTFIVTARNATNANLTNVEISIQDEVIVSREITSVRLEPSTAFLEPNIGTCSILEDSVECDIPTLSNDVDIVIDFVAEDVPAGDVDIFLTGQANQFGGLVNAIALVIVTSGGDSGCTVAAPGTSGSPSLLLFLLIPAVVFARRFLKFKV